MKTDTPQTIYLKDYTPPAFLVDTVDLDLIIEAGATTVTATLAGQAVMEGFLRMRLAPWARRLITRGIAILPAAGVTILYGSAGTGELLILTQFTF